MKFSKLQLYRRANQRMTVNQSARHVAMLEVAAAENARLGSDARLPHALGTYVPAGTTFETKLVPALKTDKSAYRASLVKIWSVGHSTAVAADPWLDPFLGQRQVQTRAAAQAQSAPQDYESSALLFPSAVGAQPNPVEATVVVVDAMFALRLPGTPLVRPAPQATLRSVPLTSGVVHCRRSMGRSLPPARISSPGG